MIAWEEIMAKSDDPVVGITGIKIVGGEGERRKQEHRNKLLKRKPVIDSVHISSRARRLADIEDLLAGDENAEGG